MAVENGDTDPPTHPVRWIGRGFVEFRAAPHPRWPLALQGALAVALPLALLTALGHPGTGLQAAAGAFTVIYGGSWSPRERARGLPIIALGLIASAAAGALLAPDPVLAAIGLIAVSIASAALAFAFSLGPPGPLFFVLVYGLATQMTHSVDGGRLVEPGLFVLTFAAGCAGAYTIALAPLLRAGHRRAHPRPLHVVLPGPRLDEAARTLVVRVVVVAIAGALIGVLWVDPQRAYWVVCSAIAVIGVATGGRVLVVRGAQRLVGTVVGAALFAALALVPWPAAALPLILGTLQFAVEMLIVRNYAAALVFITPLVLFLTSSSPGADPAVLLQARVVDTIVGAVLGAATGLIAFRRRGR